MAPAPADTSASMMIRNASCGSHWSVRWMSMWRYTGRRNDASIPVMCASGEALSTGRASGASAASWGISNSRERCVCTTPLGSDVVPDV